MITLSSYQSEKDTFSTVYIQNMVMFSTGVDLSMGGGG